MFLRLLWAHVTAMQTLNGPVVSILAFNVIEKEQFDYLFIKEKKIGFGM